MNISKLFISTTLFACATAFSVTGYAQEKLAVAPLTTATHDMTDGEIRKIDTEAKKITIRHGAIKNLDMPGMTMVFQVQDTAMLDQVKVGDKVQFVAEKLGGAIVVTAIQVSQSRP